jgi:hypothetical protein
MGDCGDLCCPFHMGYKTGRTTLFSRKMEHMKFLYLKKLHPKKCKKNKNKNYKCDILVLKEIPLQYGRLKKITRHYRPQKKERENYKI